MVSYVLCPISKREPSLSEFLLMIVKQIYDSLFRVKGAKYKGASKIMHLLIEACL